MIRGNSYISAEDISQEVFYKAFRSIYTFQMGNAAFYTWLCSIARNTVISELRRSSYKYETATEIDMEITGDNRYNPEVVSIRNETNNIVRNAIYSLSDRQKEALILREYGNLDYEEISRRLNLSLSGTKSLIHRARTLLKRTLSPKIILK